MQDDGAPRIYLREWLELLGVDITDAAKVAGISQPYMSNIIAGRKPNVNVLYLLRISEHLGITINDLYRPLPKKAQLTQLTELSPKAREKIFNLQRKKA
jgi:transcriptional regulator with XRE-family HTH domain